VTEHTGRGATDAGQAYRDEVDPGRLLVVEDDPGIGANLERALCNAGYVVRWVDSAAAARATMTPPDLVLLDLGLPDGDGLDVARDLLHRWPALPILMLTARTEEMDVVIGLDSGAADYIAKPFRLAELLARVRAQLRRPDGTVGARLLVDGDLSVDLDARRVLLEGAELQLRAKEFDLLAELLRHKGQALTREQLMANVWDEHWFGSTKTLDVHMASLRRRLGEQPGETSRITSLRGVGYRWETAS
jgi:DNA-binding response OmpR family regulator